ncbi:hypothetical protein GCM10025857_24410 [Alicyclobacillus contaminans]|nr:hypothetical protein GCM10025857_24410 [Alicyclobacillus contaminans]
MEMNNRYLTRVAPSPTHAHTPQHNGGRPNALISTPGFLDVKVEVGRSPLHVYVTHLDSREDPAVRRRQVQEMVRVMERETGAQMLLGDLNASPSAEELKPLWNLFQDAASSERAENTYPADHPTRRIDYVLVSPDIQIRSSSTLPTVASDHRPVTAEVTLPRLN